MNRKNKVRANQHQPIKSNSADPKIKARGALSLSKDGQNITLFEIERIQRLIQLQKISLSEQTLKRLAQKRELQLIKQRNIMERKRQKSLFIDFDFNPLTVQQNHNHSHTDRSNRTKINLIDAVAELRDRKAKNHVAIEKLRQRTELRIDAVLNYKCHLQKSVNFKEENNNNAQRQIRKQPASKNSLILRKAFQDLDNIISINQKRINLQKNENLNIFSILFKQRKEVFLEVRQLLAKYNFYFQSIAHSLLKQTKINPFTDISIYNRYFATNNLSEIPQTHKITSIHIFIILSSLNSNDLLLIATGKLSPTTLFQYINENALQQNSNEDDHQHQYLLKFNNYSNQLKNHLTKNQVNTSVHADDNLQIIQKMWRLQQLLQFSYKIQLQRLVHEDRTVNSYNINDKTLKSGIKQRKQQLVLGLINRTSHTYRNMESKISALKGRKDCFERSRNKAAIQIFKRYRQSLKQMQERRKRKNPRHMRKKSPNADKTVKRSKVTSEEKDKKKKQPIKFSKSTTQYE